jgi:hypothetical protein
MNRFATLLLLAMAPGMISGTANAKDAKCFTTDDGNYPCSFESTGENGSFQISAEGKPTFQLEIDADGTAFGYGQFEPEGNFVPLPGQYTRDESDGACWNNADTDTKICAW